MAWNFNHYDLLGIIEEFAKDNYLISSEEELSERFDEMIESYLDEGSMSHRDLEDEVMINEMFNNWTDMLREDGEIHEEQYNRYEYVGKYS